MILVMGVPKRGLHCDHDRRRGLANERGTIRQMLGHDMDGSCNELENIRDNMELMTPNPLREMDRLIAETGHNSADFNLLQNSDRCLLREAACVCGAFGVREWRQWKHRQRKVEELYRKVSMSRKRDSWPSDVRARLRVARKIADKALASLGTLRGTECPEAV